MVNILGLPNQDGGPFGSGFLNGFFNGQQVGQQNLQQQNAGLIPRSLGLQSQPNSSGRPALLPPVSNQNREAKENNPNDRQSKEGDRVELSKFTEDAVNQALENARKSPQAGSTSTVFVSEDGRFEASIDLQIRRDGSYDLDLAVNFAQSRAALLGTSQQQALPEGQREGDELARQTPNNFSQSLSASAERYTSFEQSLSTRGFEANIFYEEAKSVAFKAEQSFGKESGENVLNVAKEVSREFTLNISISGDDIREFNNVADQLTAFDDSGTLTGFLDATRGVLNADSTNLGSFVNATQGLINATQNHVSGKLNSFFSSMNEQYGETLEQIGFAPDRLANIGKDVEKDLQDFFSITNDFFNNLSGNKPEQVEEAASEEEIALETLDENLRQLKEERDERLANGASRQNKIASSDPTAPSGDQLTEDLLNVPAPETETRNNPDISQNPDQTLGTPSLA